jgi:predicted MFS family arabinose efflux permease
MSTGGRRDFRLFWSAELSDGIGTAVSGLALPLFLVANGYSVAAIGALVAVTGAVGLVAGPPAAVLADRGHRRSLMVGSALLAAVAMAVVALVAARGRLPLAILVGLLLVERVATSAYAAASTGSLTRIVPAGDYPTAVSRIQAAEHGTAVAGPALAGALFHLGRWLPFAVDAGSYLVSALFIRSIRADVDGSTGPDAAPGPPPDPAPESLAADLKGGVVADLTGGLRHLRSSPLMRFTLVWTTGISAILAAFTYLVIFVLNGGSATTGATTGAVLAVAGAAGLVGSVLAPVLIRRFGGGLLLSALSWLTPPVALGLGLTRSAWVLAALLGAVSVLLPAAAVALQTRVVVLTAPHLQSRVGTALTTSTATAALAAPAVVGALVQLGGQRTAGSVLAAAAGGAALYSLTLGRIDARTPADAGPRDAAAEHPVSPSPSAGGRG